MAEDDSKIFTNIHETREIQIKNFSKSNEGVKHDVRFLLQSNPFREDFILEVYPDGISPEYKGHVSVQILKLPTKDQLHKDLYPALNNIVLNFFLSVIDLKGIERCRQSFVQESIEFPLEEVIPKFLQRSFLLSLSDELLPNDVLTIRCELYGSYYMDSKVVKFSYKLFSDIDKEEEKDFPVLDNSNKVKAFFMGDDHVAREMRRILYSSMAICSHLYTPFSMDTIHRKNVKDMLTDYDECDEIRQTYLSSREMFRIYLALKEHLRKLINSDECSISNQVFSIAEPDEMQSIIQTIPGFMNCAEYLEKSEEPDGMLKLCKYFEDSEKMVNLPTLDPIIETLINIQKNTKKEDFDDLLLKISCIKKFVEEKIEIKKEQANAENLSADHCFRGQEYSFSRENEESEIISKLLLLMKLENILPAVWKNFEELSPLILRMLLIIRDGEDERLTDTHDNTMYVEHESDIYLNEQNQTKWNFYIETMDGVTFTIPFIEGEETFGSKLISCSVVFEKMLESPMREKREKRVKLIDTDSGTFVNFLRFLQKKDIKAEMFPELCNIYELADKYDVQDLKLLCADRMQDYFSVSNVDEAGELASLHSDQHLVKLVENFNEQNCPPDSEPREEKMLFVEDLEYEDEPTNQRERDFDFYQ